MWIPAKRRTLALAGALVALAHPLVAEPRTGGDAVSGTSLLANIETLSSDAFEGRAPGSPAEKLTTDFLVSKFRELGLSPGNPDGSWLQTVPLVGITADPHTELVVSGGAATKPTTLRFGEDFVAWTQHEEPQVSVDAPLVFVGYGVVAPEYHWDDYKDVDVRGKVIVMLVNDPQILDPKDPSKLDDTMFKGKAMTYYGRWTYKFEIAAARGAAGAIIVHETGPAGYPWDVVRNSNSRERFTLVSADKGRSRAALEAWITEANARSLFQRSGQDFDALHAAAQHADFRPVALGMKAKLTVKNTLRRIESHNVIARIDGRDPSLRNEFVIYSAHWDHLGKTGADIYHGAVDNASGSAGLIELARAFRSQTPKPRRSILLLSVTAEEKGLLGSQYYAEHPLYPLRETVAEINMDMLNVHGRTADVVVVGLGQSGLDDVTREMAALQHRTVHAEPQPEKGMYYRSDHLNFARAGVPALYPGSPVEFRERPAGQGVKILDEYWAHDYHKPTDIVRSDWDMRGAVEDLQLLFSVGLRVADTNAPPEWSPSSEFRGLRGKSAQ